MYTENGKSTLDKYDSNNFCKQELLIRDKFNVYMLTGKKTLKVC